MTEKYKYHNQLCYITKNRKVEIEDMRGGFCGCERRRAKERKPVRKKRRERGKYKINGEKI